MSKNEIEDEVKEDYRIDDYEKQTTTGRGNDEICICTGMFRNIFII